MRKTVSLSFLVVKVNLRQGNDGEGGLFTVVYLYYSHFCMRVLSHPQAGMKMRGVSTEQTLSVIIVPASIWEGPDLFDIRNSFFS